MPKTPATSETAWFKFYDIESLSNVFTVAVWDRRMRRIDVFWAVEDDGSELALAVNHGRLDQPALGRAVKAANPAIGDEPVTMAFWDLAEWKSNDALARMLGLSDAKLVNSPKETSSFGPLYRPVCDTDENFDPVAAHPYLAGYNSYNYDTSMSACYLTLAMGHVPAALVNNQHASTGFTAVPPSVMRRHNDAMFSEGFKEYMPGYLTGGEIANGQGWDSLAHRIRNAMLNSGRHIDISMFNEVQRRVGLKRLLGGLGRQILESEHLSHDAVLTTVEEFYALVGYNVSDVVGLAHLFDHPTYSSAFDLKNGLLHEYPETRYEKSKFGYEPNPSPYAVRRDRLGPDSTSAKFVARILAPYSNLVDFETVSFLYPAQEVVDELAAQGITITRRDILDECRDFFYTNITNERARAEFDRIYDYYASIRGRNFNDSVEYRDHYSRPENRSVLSAGSCADGSNPDGAVTQKRATNVLPAHLEPQVLNKVSTNIPYFDSDGEPSTCFATFSTGGIHGAEADWETWHAKVVEWDQWAANIEACRQAYPDPADLVQATRAEHTRITLPDGSTVDKPNVLLGSDPEKVTWRKPKKGDEVRNEQIARAQAQVDTAAELLARQRPEANQHLHTLPDGTVVDIRKVLDKVTATGQYRPGPTGRRPELFEPTPNGGNKLRPAYTHTSAGEVIHEDFTSYYPNMLRNLRAFYNPELGDDRYAKILADKDHYGKMMKDPSLTSAERERLGVLRNGTKLILNSASGAGDTTFPKQPIRVNNAIISMRLIGQIFSWRIGQAQTLAGGRIISTNTDGLYAMPTPQADTETLVRVLAEEQSAINVEIEPETLLVVSKDSNNRLEIGFKGPRDLKSLDPKLREVIEQAVELGIWDQATSRILSGSGGSLACHKGPRPDKSLAHPAVRDYALARYLHHIALGHVPAWRDTPVSLTEPLDRQLGMQILQQVLHDEDPVFAARLFQNVIAASNQKITIPFAADPLDADNPDLSIAAITNPRPLQHYNRVFYMRKGHPGAVSLRSAGAWIVNDASRAKREASKVNSIDDHTVAVDILRANGYARKRNDARNHGLTLLPEDQDIQVRKISQIDPAWHCLIENRDLHHIPADELAGLLDSLDLKIYLGLLADVFEKNWMNTSDQGAQVVTDSDEDGTDEQD